MFQIIVGSVPNLPSNQTCTGVYFATYLQQSVPCRNHQHLLFRGKTIQNKARECTAADLQNLLFASAKSVERSQIFTQHGFTHI